MTDDIKLPPLPEWMCDFEIPTDDWDDGDFNWLDWRMKEYARAAVLAYRERWEQDQRNAVLEEAIRELEARRRLLAGQNVVLDIREGLSLYDICIDAIRGLKAPNAAGGARDRTEGTTGPTYNEPQRKTRGEPGMKQRVDGLLGAALDWAVAKCEGKAITFDTDGLPNGMWEMYSSRWEHGGPIIERESLELGRYADQWQATMHLETESIFERGPTPLIAAMRCYVASKLGDEIEVPDELESLFTEEPVAAQKEDDARDAARWREWKRGNAITVRTAKSILYFSPRLESDFPECMDAAMDAAMRKESKQ